MHSLVLVMDITEYSEDKLFEMTRTQEFETRRRRKFVATCPFCPHEETAYVYSNCGVAEALAKAKVLNHIKLNHPENVASTKGA